MPRSPVLVATSLLVGAAALAGCAEKTPDIPTVSSTTAEPVAQYPITIQRFGGIAGFSDTVTIASDGGVTAKSKKATVTCTLEDASLKALNRGAAQIQPTDEPSSMPTNVDDAMDFTVSTGPGMVSVGDPRLAEAKPVIDQLLADVNAPEGQRKICT